MPHTLRLLGTTEIALITGCPPETVYRPRKVALLSYLLLTGRPVRRLEVATLLWPAVDEKRARGSLNQLMVELRRELGHDAFSTRGDDEITLNTAAFECDVITLLQAAAAGRHEQVVEAWRGDLLAGFSLAGADELNDWIDQQRRRVRDTVADSACKFAEATADAARAAEALRLCGDLRPYDEAILRRRMIRAAECSSASEAAAMYEQHRARIAEEMGTTPALETRRLLYSLCAPTSSDEQLVIDKVANHLETLGVRAAAVHVPRRPTAWLRSAPALAAAVCMLCLTLLVALRATGDAAPSVNVALMNFGDQNEPAIRALPGLVATYLIRDSALEVGYGGNDVKYQVVADLRSDADILSGTLEIRSGAGALIKSTPLRASTRVGMDTVAAQIAQFVSSVIHPGDSPVRPELALSAAQQHLLFARADYARGAVQNAVVELTRASVQLDSVAADRRDAEWKGVHDAIVREREWQMQAALQ